MENEIIEVIGDGEETENINQISNEQHNFFELITRYYQILFNFLQNGPSECIHYSVQTFLFIEILF